jgi:hypothetical protein
MLAIDLFCGLGGWAEGFLAEGYDVIGFDIERRPYPGQLVLQDVRTLEGWQFRNATCIVASPPCEEFSRWAMPWTRRRNPPQPNLEHFRTCWRIAKDSGVPIVIENVREAQRWIGTAKAHYGSRYLWGDIPAILPYLAGERTKESMGSTAIAERAKIPFDLAQWIARVFKDEGSSYALNQRKEPRIDQQEHLEAQIGRLLA